MNELKLTKQNFKWMCHPYSFDLTANQIVLSLKHGVFYSAEMVYSLVAGICFLHYIDTSTCRGGLNSIGRAVIPYILPSVCYTSVERSKVIGDKQSELTSMLIPLPVKLIARAEQGL